MTNKRKYILLLVAIPICLWLCYALAIGKTVDQRSTYRALEQEQERLAVLQENVMGLNQKEQILDSVLSGLNLQNTSLENNLLRSLSEQAEKNKVQIISYDPPHTFESEEGTTLYYDVTLGGTFQGLLAVIHALEVDGLYGEIAHAEIYLYNKRRQKKQVRARVLLKNRQ